MSKSQAVHGDLGEDAQTLFNAVGVSRIVVVDDEYATLDVEELLGICSEAPVADSRALPHLQEVHFDDPYDLWAREVRGTWETLDQTSARS